MIVVTLCGSAKFRVLITRIGEALRSRGFVVLAPTLLDMEFTNSLTHDERLLAWKGGTYSHFQRLSRCDICLVCNPDGYSGVSTTLELGFATALGRLVVTLGHDHELARQSLFDHVLGTTDPEEVAVKLSEYVGLGR
jgi:hypothetical protein